MKDPFTDDLERSLTDFVTNTSDEEFRRGLLEADYDYYSNVEEPHLAMREFVFTGEVRIGDIDGIFPLGISNAQNLLVTRKFSAIIAETPPAADHHDLALAA
jgi:hypothetical protein